MKKVVFILNQPSYDSMPFDRWDSDHYVHATGRDVWGYDFHPDGTPCFMCEPEYEDGATVDTPTTDLVKRLAEIEEALGEYEGEYRTAKNGECADLLPDNFWSGHDELLQEQQCITEFLYELWDDDRLDAYSITLPANIVEQFKEVADMMEVPFN